jgi:Raf kinase inhibitor-like YbhB/YbcL family protein
MKLTSSAFTEGGLIAPKYTCDGEDVSPPLEWMDVPEGAKSLALIVDDPDAPSGVFVHWLIYGIPPQENGLTEGVGIENPTAGGGRQGTNGFGTIGYRGPCPPSGTHRYYFRLHALDQDLSNLRAGASRQELDRSIQGHSIGSAELMGRYERKNRRVPE